MRHLYAATIFLVLFAASTITAQAEDADDYTKTIKVFQESEVVAPFFKDSFGYAVFPTVGKAGLGIGGAYGKGQVYRQGQPTGTSKLVKLSIGFQAGGQLFSEIVFFKDQRAYDEFTSGSFEFDASASAVVITAGAQATASSSGTSAGVSAGPKTGEQLGGDYVKGMATFVHTKGGLMYEAAIGGQSFSFQPLK